MTKYSPEVAQRMNAVRKEAQSNPFAVCWWCGERPRNNRWHADHIFALLGEWGPVLAACEDCNKIRRRRLPTMDRCRRAFHSDRVVRSVSRGELQEIARRKSEDLFGTTEWITLLMAADNTPDPRQIIRSGRYKGGIAHRETDKLREMLAGRQNAAI